MTWIDRPEDAGDPKRTPVSEGDLAHAAVQITRQVELPRVLHEVAVQARTLTGAERVVAEVSREVIGREPLRVISIRPDAVLPEDTDAPLSALFLGENGEQIGSIRAYPSVASDRFGAEEQVMLDQLAQIASAAIVNARLRATERRTRSHAARLQELTAALSEALTLQEVTGAVVHHLTDALDADGAVVTRCTEDGLELEILDAEDMPADARAAWARFPASADIPLAEVARTGHAIFLESREAWIKRYPELEPVIESSRHHANAIVPLIVQGTPIGSIGLAFCEPRQFDPDERALIMSIARQCAFALERARIYESEHEARHRAELANASKSEFLAVMSHELRTPLNSIAGYADLMLMGIHGPITDSQREDLERIQRSQRHLLALINNLLDYAKLEGGRVHIAHEKVCVIDVIETVISLATPQMRAKEITGRYRIARDLNLLADRAKVEQILLNLVINAVKFTSRGGSVTIGARLADSVVEITISDTGIGIPPEMMDVIFEPFMQLSSPLTSPTPGTGLGLAISRDLARLMNGTITVERELPQGAQFTVTLPVFIDVDEESPLDPEIMMREF